jgi:hypothetical protein
VENLRGTDHTKDVHTDGWILNCMLKELLNIALIPLFGSRKLFLVGLTKNEVYD